MKILNNFKKAFSKKASKVMCNVMCILFLGWYPN